MDKKHTGFINADDLTIALHNSEHEFSWVDIQAMLTAADKTHDGKISKEEFIQMCERVCTASSTTHTPHQNTSTQNISGVNIDYLKLTDTITNNVEVKYDNKKPLKHQEKHLSPEEIHGEIKYVSKEMEKSINSKRSGHHNSSYPK